MFYLLIYSPNFHNSWGWLQLKPGARNFMKVSQLDGSDPSFVYHLLPFRRISMKLNRSGVARLLGLEPAFQHRKWSFQAGA